MRLEPLCAFDLQYTSDVHLVRPHGNGAEVVFNNAVCVGEGVISAETLTMHLEVFQCLSEI